MYQRMLPEDERLRGRTTCGRRLWTQRFCKQWKFVRRRIGLRQVELTLAQKRAKAPCLQVFLFGVFVMPLSMYFVTSKLILGYSEDSTRQDGSVFCSVCSSSWVCREARLRQLFELFSDAKNEYAF